MTAERLVATIVLTVFANGEVTDMENFRRRGDQFMEAIKQEAAWYGLDFDANATTPSFPEPS